MKFILNNPKNDIFLTFEKPRDLIMQERSLYKGILDSKYTNYD